MRERVVKRIDQFLSENDNFIKQKADLNYLQDELKNMDQPELDASCPRKDPTLLSLDVSALEQINQIFLPGWTSTKISRNLINIAIGYLFSQILNVNPQLKRAQELLEN